MIPLFKSHYSIGKSILTLNNPEDSCEDGSDSIFSILLENKIRNLVLVEDSPIGFLQAKTLSEKLNINFIFGLRVNIKCEDSESLHKTVIFLKNAEGYKSFCKLLTEINFMDNSVANYSLLKKHWSNEHFLLAIPFYDSFLFYNSFSFSQCIPDFSFCEPIFFIEDNNLPIDSALRSIVFKYCSSFGYQTFEAKTILYKLKSDVEALQTYKCICSRNIGRSSSLQKPNLEGFGSSDFCFESFLEKSS